MFFHTVYLFANMRTNLLQVIRRCPLILFQIPSDILNSIFSIAVAGMTLQERLALRAVMSFIVSFSHVPRFRVFLCDLHFFRFYLG
jgi:hypothetical protein